MKGSISILMTSAAFLAAGCAQSTLTSPGSGPAQVLIASGDAQTAAVGAPLPTPLGVMVIDDNGKPVSGVTVAFAATAGSLASTTATTDANGMAQDTFTLGSTAGDETVTATAAGVPTPATFTETGS